MQESVNNTASEAAASDHSDASPQRLEVIGLGGVKICALNPRKKVNPAGIDEMAESILAHGIIQPPVARPAKEGGYEIVFGQRRYLGLHRAIDLAEERGIPRPPAGIPLLIREMDDNTVREESWVENLQREDVSVREESLGFEDLLSLIGADGEPIYSVTRLAAKLGKDPAFISRRLKLKGVPESMWEALDEGLLGVRQLELVGCLPTQEMRDKAAQAVLKPRFRTSPPLTVKETQALIRDEFLVSLQGVEWGMKDADLVKVAIDGDGQRIGGGACQDCDFRTGRNPDLQASLSDGSGTRGWKGNSCMLPTCFKRKKAAIWEQTKKAALEANSKVLTDSEAKEVFSEWGGEDDLQRSSGLVVLSSSPGYQETGHHAEETVPSWEVLIGDKLPAEQVVLARNPRTGAIRRLLSQKLAIKLAEESLKEQGKPSPFEKRKKEKEQKAAQPLSEWQIDNEVKRKLSQEFCVWLRGRGREQVEFSEQAREELFVYLARSAADDVGVGAVCGMLGIVIAELIEDHEQIEDLLEAEIRTAVKKGEAWWLLVELVISRDDGLDLVNDYVVDPRKLCEAIGFPTEAKFAEAEAAVAAEEAARLAGTEATEAA